MVWVGLDGNDYEIFMYDGSETTQLTVNEFDDWYPDINDNGYVVWQCSRGDDYEIFISDGLTTTQLTDNEHND